MTDDELITGLRAWAGRCDAGARAAVELLIEHDHWLWDDGFRDRCVLPDPDGREPPCIDFTAVRHYHASDPPSSVSQAAILLVIADLGAGRWQLGTLDGRNRQRVAGAVARAAELLP